MKKYIILLVILIMGCSTVFKDIDNLVSLNNEVGIGNVIKSVELTDVEIMILTHNTNYFNSFIDKWKDTKPMDIKSDAFKEFLSDFYILKSKYIETENIIVKHWDLYDDTSKVSLSEYKKRAVQANKTVEYLQNNATKYEVLLQSLVFAKAVIGLLK